MDDARSPQAFHHPPRPPAGRSLALPLCGALAGAALTLVLLAHPGLVPAVPRYVCRTVGEQGFGVLEGRAASAEAALAAVRLPAIAAAEEAAAEARRSLAAMVGEWRSAPPGPHPALAAAAECAARLRARAGLATALAGEGQLAAEDDAQSAAGTPADSSTSLSPAAAALDRADQAVERAALARDPATLAAALRDEDAAEAAWLAAGRERALDRLARWRARERDRAEQFLLAASDLEQSVTPFQIELVGEWLPAIALEMRAAAIAPLEAAAGRRLPPVVRPIVVVWIAGAVLGLALGAALGWLLRALLRASSRSRSEEAGPAPGGAEASFLQLVGGDRPEGMERAVRAVTLPFLARGERVLIVDASAAALHRRFGAVQKWGLEECLAGELPLLGAVQPGEAPGLFLLTRGEAGKASNWSALGRVVDDARSYFSRVVLAIDAGAPAALGVALSGRPLEAWWPLSDSRRGGKRLMTRLDIPFQGITIPADLKIPLEAGHAPAPEPHAIPTLVTPVEIVGAAEVSEQLRAAMSERARATRGAGPEPPGLLQPEPAPEAATAIESDARTRERLRFLIWMRGVRIDPGARVADEPRTAPPSGPSGETSVARG
jgi:hypothetical protein